jgi:hypothetical protein
MKALKFISVVAFSLLFISSIAQISPSTSAQSTQQSAGTPSWVFAGAFLNYSVSANLGAAFTLSNGSSLSLSLNFTGSVKEAVNSISGSEANVSSTPNLVLKDIITYFNGTTKTDSQSYTPANASTSTIPLSELNFGKALQEALNSTSSSFFFSPKLNTTLSKAPAMFYQLNSTTKVAALQLSSMLSEKSTIPSSIGAGGSFSINGTSDSYTTLAQGIPLKETLSLQASGTLNALPLGGVSQQGGTARGSFDLTVTLVDTNISLSSGNVEQSVIQIPNYSTQLDVVSNSTITSASTSGNELIVNVTGPSGTTGVLDVVVSPALLNESGISSASQVGVTVDGQTYTNYTVTNLGGSYLFTIYYHHSSHGIVLGFGNANLGTNKGTVSSLSLSPSVISTTLLIEIAVAAVIAVVIVVVIAFMRSSRSRGMLETSSAPPPASPS